MRGLGVLLAVLAAGPAVAQIGSDSVPAPFRPLPTLAEAPEATPTPAAPPTQEEGESPDPTGGAPTPTPEDRVRERFTRVPGEGEQVERGMTPIDPVATVERPGAALRGLDKMTGAIADLALATGERAPMARLVVELLACREGEGSDISGTMAFVKVWDTKGGGMAEVFSGWMFADSPALSAMDHPRYDLWLIGCTGE